MIRLLKDHHSDFILSAQIIRAEVTNVILHAMSEQSWYKALLANLADTINETNKECEKCHISGVMNVILPLINDLNQGDQR